MQSKGSLFIVGLMSYQNRGDAGPVAYPSCLLVYAHVYTRVHACTHRQPCLANGALASSSPHVKDD
jgi:hypothetical protein